MKLFFPLALTILSTPVIQAVSSCQTPQSVAGQCISLRSCPSLLRLLRRRPLSVWARAQLRASVCGRGYYVCCPLPPLPPNPTTALPPTTSAPITTTPAPEPLIPTECGRQDLQFGGAASSRVVGGEPAKIGHWPWIAALGYSNPSGGEPLFLCGGTLVGRKHVVTAAHCVRDDLSFVLLGEISVNNNTHGAKPQQVAVTRALKHPNYNHRAFANDIAVLELSRYVDVTPWVRPICLPSKAPSLKDDTDHTDVVGDRAHIAGWGAVKFNGPKSGSLQQAQVTVIGEQECKTKLASFRKIRIDDTKVCARDPGNMMDACQGDSGGPLTTFRFSDDRKYRFHLLGVVSFGYQCAVPGFPGVYTRVSEFEDWIRDIISG